MVLFEITLNTTIYIPFSEIRLYVSYINLYQLLELLKKKLF